MRYVYWLVQGVVAGRPGPSLEYWDLNEIASNNIKGIISLAGNVDSKTMRALEIAHLQIDDQLPSAANEQIIWLRNWMPRILQFVAQAATSSGATIVHCHHGLDRTGVVLGCIMVVVRNISADSAIELVQQANHDALGHQWHCDIIRVFADDFTRHPDTYPDIPLELLRSIMQ